MTLQVEAFGLTDPGPRRSNNEDTFLISENPHCWIVADGLGGHRAGEVASLEAAHFILGALRQDLGSDPRDSLRQAILCANTHLYEQAWMVPEWDGMGTTLSCALVIESKLYFAHVGDSRIYLLRDRLHQISEDHSLRRSLKNPSKRLTRCIGVQPELEPHVGMIPLQPQDRILLCSDGLSDFVPETVLESVLRSDKPLPTLCSWCIELAHHHGTTDNVTVAIAQVYDHLPG